ncbi:HYR domain-containing protein [uncultured Maribacter sp.]|uniref:HYR domain-containing protein n=1 Tax=uncultured Maribacter sp. TaxID=431308 RepID=UPI00261B4EA9|nr:HYR domain-containing protein [uncultured Maribacter sp.]
MLKNNFFQILLACLFTSIISCSNDEKEEEQKDAIAPSITCLDPINVNIEATANDAIVTYTTPEGTDNIAGAVTKQTTGLASGESFPIGTTTNTFVVTDAAGNTTSCNFDVIVARNAPSENKPYFIGDDPTPTGKKWTSVAELSDEFNTDIFDDSKWFRDPSQDQFGWYGREPALFQPDNVSVGDGSLNVTVKKLQTPITSNGRNWTHGGAILRSKTKAIPGYYYEARMKANETVMSSTFWIAFPQNCNSGPFRKLELDIQECVGRTHNGTDSWAKEWDNIYHSNAWRHARPCDINSSVQSPGKKDLEEKNHSRYFVYGCWWKSPTEILFYLDGEYVYTIKPSTDFDLEGHITMVMETYDWNPIEPENDLTATGTEEQRTTKYDWVRTWKLEDQ